MFFRIIFILFFSSMSIAQPISFPMQSMDLRDALRLIAKRLQWNVVVSPAVNGIARFNMENANPADTFKTLLLSHGLSTWRSGNILFIASQAEFIKLKQDELKRKELEEELSPLITKIWQIKYAKAEDIAHLIVDEQASLLSKRGRLRVDVRTNTICVKDIDSHIKSMMQLISHIDVLTPQIAIEARLVSIDSDFEKELGIQFGVKTRERGKPENGHYSLLVAKLPDGSLLDMKLAALENAGHAELISSPSLFTANQQPASIEAGEEVPYQEVSESGGTAVVFKKAVLGLKVTPQVLPHNQVLLQLQINQDRPSNKMVQGMPTISTRQMSASVLAKSGQTIVLGGIYEANTEVGRAGLPFINRIPILCWLFQQHSLRKNKRELMIFVTPHIIKNA
jgi:type IV pilus assembly protein PilQ